MLHKNQLDAILQIFTLCGLFTKKTSPTKCHHITGIMPVRSQLLGHGEESPSSLVESGVVLASPEAGLAVKLTSCHHKPNQGSILRILGAGPKVSAVTQSKSFLLGVLDGFGRV